MLECERLAFVPRGVAHPFSDVPCWSLSDMLVDRFEVTRELWLAVTSEVRALPALDGRFGDWASGSPWLPAVGMDLDEARAFARARGMRLPTVAEWMYVAGGSRAQFWPHGNSREVSVANTSEVSLGRAAPAGTFPNGQTSTTRIHDLIGNVQEWVTPPLPRGVAPSLWRGPGDSPFSVWAMGGSYLWPARELYGSPRQFNAQGFEPGHRAADLGMRCVVEAEPYLIERAQAWSEPEQRERIVAVGRLWGPRAVGLLEELAARPAAAPALEWLLEGARQ